MINKNLYVILFLFVFGCSGYEFVYDKKLLPNMLKNTTIVSIVGDDTSVLIRSLNEKIGAPENKKFKLQVISKKTTSDVVKKINMTASLIEIKFDVSYKLVLIEKNCIIFNKKISSKSTHDEKAGGYNFGSDISKKEIIESVVEANVTEYLKYISSNYSSLTC